MAISIYDEQFLNDEQRKRLQAFTDAWNQANARGDRAGMEAAHAAAERVRAEANYSGTMDGSGFVDLGGGSGGQSGGFGGSGSWDGQSGGSGGWGDLSGSAGGWGGQTGSTGGSGYAGGGYSPTQLPSYEAAVKEVNDLYDAARARKLGELKAAYDRSLEALRAEAEKLPGLYDVQRNEAAAEAELAGRNFNEYAAATGLNSGAAGQAALARSNRLQGELAALGQQEAEAQTEAARRETDLRTKYAGDVADAVAQGELDRAAALLEEYRRAEESRVETARKQADENYRAWQSGVTVAQAVEKARQEAAQAAEKARQEAAQAQAEAASASRKEALERAERLAEAGDFSGYLALGYSQAETEAMRQAWIAKNPAAAYRAGLITWEELNRLTGK